MKKEINIQMGLRIREKRELLRMSRETLAELTDISPTFLSDVENGMKGISFTTLQKMCAVLHTSADYLVLGTTEHTDTSRLCELLEHIDQEYLPMVEELICTYIKSIEIIKHQTVEKTDSI